MRKLELKELKKVSGGSIMFDIGYAIGEFFGELSKGHNAGKKYGYNQATD